MTCDILLFFFFFLIAFITPSELQLFDNFRRVDERAPLLNLLSSESGVASNCVKTFLVTADNEYAGLVLDRESRLPSLQRAMAVPGRAPDRCES
jgi:hypothetical protein